MESALIMDKVSPIEILIRNPNLLIMVLLLIVVFIGFGFVFLVQMGNLSAMKFLAKNGVAVFSKNIEKDYKLLNYVNKEGVGWIHIPNIIYAPIMTYSNGLYTDHNFLKKSSLYGEIFITETDSMKEVDKIRKEDRDLILKDLTLIRGSAKGKQMDLRHANFSSLSKVVETIAEKGIVNVYEEKGKREFYPVAVVDITKGNTHKFEYTSREKFIDSIIGLSKVQTKQNYNKDNNVILLQCKTEIDTLLVLLIEKGEK